MNQIIPFQQDPHARRRASVIVDLDNRRRQLKLRNQPILHPASMTGQHATTSPCANENSFARQSVPTAEHVVACHADGVRAIAGHDWVT
ncbi:hypothetical protein OH802_05890 [Nocardioides sp. NBC_00850]|uniref:hypothetical protein n=1 Tax=Nocardioides sp. NBC_00850 TaxID=2976001 RepID=UPI0038684AD0|nr:hypothetical protein OH802_05890 [Nocardioides sp. NBC_00850]